MTHTENDYNRYRIDIPFCGRGTKLLSTESHTINVVLIIILYDKFAIFNMLARNFENLILKLSRLRNNKRDIHVISTFSIITPWCPKT